MAQLTADKTDYLGHYALQVAPFKNDIDGQFFFAGRTLMQRLDLLSHLTQFGDSIVVVTGPQGSGKTTLLDHLAKTARNDWTVCSLSASQVPQLQHILAAHLGGYPDATSRLLITEWVNRSHDNDLLVVLLDDAHELTQDDLSRLAVLFDERVIDHTRLILFGAPELADVIQNAVNNNILNHGTQLLEMPRYTEDETTAYLQHRLAVAGYSGDSPFTETEVRAICKAADGRPASINTQAELCLIEGFGRPHIKTVAHPARKSFLSPMKIALLSGFILTGLLGWFFSSTQKTGSPDLVTQQDQPLLLPPSQPIDSIQSSVNTDAIVLTGRSGLIDRSTTITPEKTVPLQQNKTESIITPIDAARVSQTAVETRAETENQPVETSELMTTANKAVDSLGSSATKPDDQKPQPNETPATHVQPDTETVTEKLVGTADDVSKITSNETDDPQNIEHARDALNLAKDPASVKQAKNDVSIINTSATDTNTAKPASTTNNALSQREDWLKKQSSTAWTLQILGSHKESSVQKFIRDNRLPADKTTYYRTKWKNRDWYVVLYGIYKNKDIAVSRISDLPDGIRFSKPWPRKIGHIQQTLRKSGNN